MLTEGSTELLFDFMTRARKNFQQGCSKYFDKFL